MSIFATDRPVPICTAPVTVCCAIFSSQVNFLPQYYVLPLMLAIAANRPPSTYYFSPVCGSHPIDVFQDRCDLLVWGSKYNPAFKSVLLHRNASKSSVL